MSKRQRTDGEKLGGLLGHLVTESGVEMTMDEILVTCGRAPRLIGDMVSVG